MVDDRSEQRIQTSEQGEQDKSKDIFWRDLSGSLKNGLGKTISKMWESQTQYGEYYTQTSTGVEIRLDTKDSGVVPGTTPDRITASLKDGNKTRKVTGKVEVTQIHEPSLNLSGYEAAPVYPEKANITALNDKRTVELPDGIRVTKEYGIRDNQGTPVVSEGALRVIVPLKETPIVDGKKINIVVDRDGEDVDDEPNAVVYTKRQFEHGGDSWTKTYVVQNVDRYGKRGAISYPQSDGYADGNYKVMDLDLDETDQSLVDGIVSEVQGIETPPVFNSVFGVEIQRK